MQTRFFRYDKNYLLREAQEGLRQRLLLYLCSQARRAYQQHFNPLGLLDSTTVRIYNTRPNVESLHHMYDAMAAIYRYRNSSNQLELLFNGKTHLEQYSLDWSKCFALWCKGLCADPAFVRLLLGITVLQAAGNRSTSLAEQRLRSMVQERFGLKVHKRRGILEQTA
ncbi:hypothetical protein D770_13045 [Flammeovirgaceae bacterium 311]|nr:hypothetical protein D770_13045 [Flammeovirgaceae bacterium 311]